MKTYKTLLAILLFSLIGVAVFADDIEGDSSDKAKPDELETVFEAMSTITDVYPGLCLNTKVELETGLVFTGYSDVRIPGDNGTLFSLSKDLDAKLAPAMRIKMTRTFGERHNLSWLSAFLRVKSEGKADRDIVYGDTVFPAGTELDGIYWFNSHRLTYRYDFVQSFLTDFGLGLTAKIREAGIKLESNIHKAQKTNIGFVPIINFRYNRYLTERLNLLIEGDALAAPQGRAEDVYAGVTYRFNKNNRLKVGYRMLEGGADNDEVYNFALFHYATIGVEF